LLQCQQSKVGTGAAIVNQASGTIDSKQKSLETIPTEVPNLATLPPSCSALGHAVTRAPKGSCAEQYQHNSIRRPCPHRATLGSIASSWKPNIRHEGPNKNVSRSPQLSDERPSAHLATSILPHYVPHLPKGNMAQSHWVAMCQTPNTMGHGAP
jgi:hypothetical protein